MSDPAAPPRERRIRRRWPRVVLVVVLVLVALVVAARVALEPIAKHQVEQALARLHGVRSSFGAFHLKALKLTAEVDDLKIDKVTPSGQTSPFVSAKKVEASLYGKEFLHGHVVANIEVLAPRVEIISAEKGSERNAAPDIARVLEKVTGLRLDRLAVRKGELVFVDNEVKGRPRIRLTGIELTLENFATRAALARGEPAILAASATLERSGQLSVFATADPLAKKLTFACEARLIGLDMRDVAPLLAAISGVKASGTLDVSARFRSDAGHLTGGVRPVLQNPSVEQAKPGLDNALKAALADGAVNILSDRVPNRNAVATTIPIHGDVEQPGVEAWPTVIAVVRNAFVVGLTDSLTNLPPKSAKPGEAEARRAPGRK